MPLNRIAKKLYVKKIEPSPLFSLESFVAFEIQGFNLEGLGKEELNHAISGLDTFLRLLPEDTHFKVFLFNTPGRLKIEKRGGEKRRRFLKRLEEFYRTSLNVREFSLYFLVPKEVSNELYDRLSSLGLSPRVANEEFYEKLNLLLGKDTKRKSFVFEPWNRGAKILDSRLNFLRYAAVLPMLSAPDLLHPFHLSFLLNFLDDFAFVLSFEKPSERRYRLSLEAKWRVFSTTTDKAMREVVEELSEFLKEVSLGRESLFFVSANFMLFGEDERELLRKLRFYEAEFGRFGLSFLSEGSSEYDAFLISFEKNLSRTSYLGYVRKVSSKVMAYLLPFFSPPKGARSGAPLFTLSGTPFYVDLYEVMPPNAIGVGQMGGGKSTFASFLSLFLDNVVFVEKIERAQGSYGVFTKVFDGNYYPVTPDRPVSFAPFGDTIYKPDEIDFVEKLGYSFDEFSEPELQKLSDLLESFFFGRKKVKKREILEKLSLFEGTEFLRYKIERSPLEEWEVKKKVNADKLIFLKTLLYLMHTLGTDEKIDPSIVEEVILKTYEKFTKGGWRAQREILMHDFYETARELGYESFARRLRSYTRLGAYGGFFDRPSTVKFGEYTCFELRIKGKEIVPLVILSILTMAVERFSKPDMLGKKRGFILDEAWFLIEDPFVMSFIEEALRTYRKKGIFVVLLSQFADDFSKGPGSKIAASSPYKFILYTDPTEHQNVKKAFSLKEEEKELLKLVGKAEDYGYRFSRMYAITPYKSALGTQRGILHLVPSREFYWISTTNDRDVKKREEYKQKYKDLYRAIEVLADEDLSR